jgi:hypothetical protein
MAKIKEQIINKNLTVVGDLTVVGEINRGELVNAANVAKASAYSIKNRPKFGETLNGFITGGTTVPTVPTIQKALGIYQGITLMWDRQLDLSNFSHYEIQVSDDSTNWYSLGMDGTDWKAGLGLTTNCPYEFFVHPGITIATALYYRIRRATKAPAVSAWSAIATTSALQTANSSTAFNSIYVNSIVAAYLQVIFAQVTAQLTIGYAGTGTIETPAEGDRRVYIDEDEIGFEVYTNGGWATARSIKLGGVDGSGNFLPFLSCRGLLGDMADAPAADPLPDSTFYRFTFDDTLYDDTGAVVWVLDIGGVQYNATPKWEGTKSFGGLAGAIYLSGAWVTGHSTSVCTMFYATNLPGAADRSIFLLSGDANNYIDFVHDHTTNTLVVSVKKGGTLTDIDTGLSISAATWNFMGLIYDSTTDTIYVRVGPSSFVINPIPGVWGGATGYLFIYAWGSTLATYFDDFIFSPTVAIDPEIFLQHVQRGVPWESSTTALDVIVKAQTGGTIRLLSPTAYYASVAGEPSLGTPHPHYKELVTNADPSGAGYTTVDCSGEVPVGATQIYVALIGYSLNVAAYLSLYTDSTPTPAASPVEINFSVVQAQFQQTGLVRLSSNRSFVYRVSGAEIYGVYIRMFEYWM